MPQGRLAPESIHAATRIRLESIVGRQPHIWNRWLCNASRNSGPKVWSSRVRQDRINAGIAGKWPSARSRLSVSRQRHRQAIRPRIHLRRRKMSLAATTHVHRTCFHRVAMEWGMAMRGLNRQRAGHCHPTLIGRRNRAESLKYSVPGRCRQSGKSCRRSMPCPAGDEGRAGHARAVVGHGGVTCLVWMEIGWCAVDPWTGDCDPSMAAPATATPETPAARTPSARASCASGPIAAGVHSGVLCGVSAGSSGPLPQTDTRAAAWDEPDRP